MRHLISGEDCAIAGEATAVTAAPAAETFKKSRRFIKASPCWGVSHFGWHGASSGITFQAVRFFTSDRRRYSVVHRFSNVGFENAGGGLTRKFACENATKA
jgi:hypothetical protein